MEIEKKKTYSIKEVGEILGLSRVTVWRLVKEGYLPGVYQKTPLPGSVWVVPAASVEKFLQERGG